MNPQEELRAIELREEYIADVTSRLQNRLSAGETYEQVTEIREHLEAMSRAFQEVGEPEASAMRMAIEKFGKSSEIGENIVKATAGQPRRLPLMPPGLAALAILNAALAFFWVTVCRESSVWRIFGSPVYAGTSTSINFMILAVLAGVLCWYMPKLTPARAALVGLAAVNLNLPARLYIEGHAGLIQAFARLPWLHFAGVCAICALSAHMAPRFRRLGRRTVRVAD